MNDYILTREEKQWCRDKACETILTYEFISRVLVELKGSKIGAEHFLQIHKHNPRDISIDDFKKLWFGTITYNVETIGREFERLKESLGNSDFVKKLNKLFGYE